MMDKSFDPTHAESCVDVQESHNEEFNDGGGGLLSDNQLRTAYSYSTWGVSSHRDDETTPVWKNASLSGSGPVEKNLVVSG